VLSQAELYCVIFDAGSRTNSASAKKERARIGIRPTSGLLEVRGKMSHPFQHPLAKGLLRRVAQLFKSDKAYILRDSNIVFVCGGPIADSSTMRSRFVKYAADELGHLRMFLAEDAEKDYITHDDPEFHNVAEFEEIIGAVSDCLIIFPESAGSFAELGYFSQSELLRKKF
jgi:hypothetical protein